MTERATVVAYHEAGHAVAAEVLGAGLLAATIVPGEDYAGQVRYTCPPASADAAAAAWARREVVISLAGRAATAHLDPAGAGCGRDYREALSYASEVCGTDPADAPALGQMVRDCWDEALALVNRYRWAIGDVARALRWRGTIEGNELREMVREAVARDDRLEEQARRRYGYHVADDTQAEGEHDGTGAGPADD